jgi:hypothetical protein
VFDEAGAGVDTARSTVEIVVIVDFRVDDIEVRRYRDIK